jgi:hypothetical protein
MKIEDAIKQLKIKKTDIELCIGLIKQGNQFVPRQSSPLLEAISIAIKALEKQIPKEPIVLLKDEDGYAYQFEHYLCPDCKNIFVQRPQGSKVPLHTPKYCPDCGQAIKWSD